MTKILGIFLFLIFSSLSFGDCGFDLSLLATSNEELLSPLADLAKMAVALEKLEAQDPHYVSASVLFKQKAREFEKLVEAANLDLPERDKIREGFRELIRQERNAQGIDSKIDYVEEDRVRALEQSILSVRFNPVLDKRKIEKADWFKESGFRLLSGGLLTWTQYYTQDAILGKKIYIPIFDSAKGRFVHEVSFYEGEYGGVTVAPKLTSSFGSIATINVKPDLNQGSSKPRLYVWDVATEKYYSSKALADASCIGCIGWISDGAITVPKPDRTGIDLYTRDLSRPYCSLDGEIHSSSKVTFGSKGKYLGLTHIGPDDKFAIWDIGGFFTAKQLKFKTPKTFNRGGVVTDIYFDLTGKHFYTRTVRGFIDLWDLESKKYIKNILTPSETETLGAFQVTQAGSLILRMDPIGEIKKQGQRPRVLVINSDFSQDDFTPPKNEELKGIEASPDGAWLALSSIDPKTFDTILSVRSLVTGHEVLRKVFVWENLKSVEAPVWSLDGAQVTIKVSDRNYVFLREENR